MCAHLKERLAEVLFYQVFGSWPIARLAASLGRKIRALSPDAQRAAIHKIYQGLATAGPDKLDIWQKVAECTAYPRLSRHSCTGVPGPPSGCEVIAETAQTQLELDGVRMASGEAWQLICEASGNPDTKLKYLGLVRNHDHCSI